MTQSYQQLIINYALSLQIGRHFAASPFAPFRKFSTSIDCTPFTSPVWAYRKRRSWRRRLTTADRRTTTALVAWHSSVGTARCRITPTSTWITNIRRKGSSDATGRLLPVFSWRSSRRPFPERIIPMSLPGKNDFGLIKRSDDHNWSLLWNSIFPLLLLSVLLSRHSFNRCCCRWCDGGIFSTRKRWKRSRIRKTFEFLTLRNSNKKLLWS